jgi:hypothetical protein
MAASIAAVSSLDGESVVTSGVEPSCLTSTTSPHQRQLHFPIDLLV